ncbi:unnamed protein product [Cladocopium goreaui]|uniref:Oligopeptidase A n=1 Tax=Cladocopium goreaui TaxID=2562237 RepID=A0A9P1BIK1_9DINO|nr:unnamed protein product [Cladocopium goreaui]
MLLAPCSSLGGREGPESRMLVMECPPGRSLIAAFFRVNRVEISVHLENLAYCVTDLNRFLGQGRPTMTTSRQIFAQVLLALEYQHDESAAETGLNVVFLDMKRGNIVLDAQMNAKLINFGLAKAGFVSSKMEDGDGPENHLSGSLLSSFLSLLALLLSNPVVTLEHHDALLCWLHGSGGFPGNCLTDALIEEQAFRQEFEEAVRAEIKHECDGVTLHLKKRMDQLELKLREHLDDSLQSIESRVSQDFQDLWQWTSDECRQSNERLKDLEQRVICSSATAREASVSSIKECLEQNAKLSARIDDLCDALVKEVRWIQGSG